MMFAESWIEAVEVIAKRMRHMERTIYELRHENEKLKSMMRSQETIPAPPMLEAGE